MHLDPRRRLRLGSDHVATSIGSETAVMSIMRGRYYAMGDVAEEIWLMLETPVSPDEIAERLVAAYDVTPEVCRTQVNAFLERLVEEGLVVEAAA